MSTTKVPIAKRPTNGPIPKSGIEFAGAAIDVLTLSEAAAYFLLLIIGRSR